MRNRLAGGWSGGGRESRARPLYPISIWYKQDDVRIHVNTILFAVYNSLKYLFDSVVGIENTYVLGVEQGNKEYPSHIQS